MHYTGWKRSLTKPLSERTNADALQPAHIHFHLKFPPSASSFQTLWNTRQMNATHFLFTFDLPLSPKNLEEKSKTERESRSQTEGGERGREESKNGG